MPSNWEVVKLEDVAARHASAMATGPFGSSISAKYFTDSGVPVIRGSNLSADVSIRLIDEGLVFVSFDKAKEFQRSIVRRGDLVFTCWGSINQVGLIDESATFDEYIVSNKQMKLTLDPSRADPRFVYYVFSGPEKQSEILENGIGSSVPGFNLGQLRSHRIYLPPLAEQQAISGLLKNFDDRIDLLRQTNATLESIAQALFKSWFIDFDPVRAKAEGREPEGMDADTAALFPSEFEESELGAIPKRWRVGGVYDIADIIYGAPFASKQFNSEGIGLALVRIRDLKDETPGVWTPEVHPKGYKLRPGDIVVGMDGEFRAHLWGGDEAWMNQRICVFKPINGHSATFVRLAIAAPLAHVEATETATTVIHLGKGDIDRFRIVVPPPTVAAAFTNVGQPLYDSIVSGKRTARLLSELRDTLLPRLISGKLRITEAMEQVEEALT